MNNALLIKKPYQLHLHLFVNLPNFLGPQRIRCFLLCKIDFHLRTVTVDPHFITSNYWFKKISTNLAHSSKPKVICFWCLFCSCITSCGTNFSATLLMCQSTVKMVCNNTNEMPKSLLSFLIIRQWLNMDDFVTFFQPCHHCSMVKDILHVHIYHPFNTSSSFFKAFKPLKNMCAY